MKPSNTTEDDDVEEYRERRDKNNVAVRRSREKSKQKISETKQRVSRLKKQNAELNNQVEVLSRELSFLKELFGMQCNQKENTNNILHQDVELQQGSFYNEDACEKPIFSDRCDTEEIRQILALQ